MYVCYALYGKCPCLLRFFCFLKQTRPHRFPALHDVGPPPWLGSRLQWSHELVSSHWLDMMTIIRFDCSSHFLVCQFWWQFYFSMAGAPQTCCWDRAKISRHPMPIPPVAKHTALIWWKMTQIQRGTAQGSIVKACIGFWILSTIYINIYTHVHIYLYTCISINTVWQYM